jgi:hypothetical protein
MSVAIICMWQLILTLLITTTTMTHCFVSVEQQRRFMVRTTTESLQVGPVFSSLTSSPSSSSSQNTARYVTSNIDSIEEASRILSEFDKFYNPESPAAGSEQNDDKDDDDHNNRQLVPSIRFLSGIATDDRNRDSTTGRCMLGVCAPSAEVGLATLKAWVTALDLPRGLLHGMDKDGIPLDINGPVYIKYNSGGVYTFTDIRKSGLGFDALWKPGDAMLEPYDGTYRGVYFQVELKDGEFRQYMVPLDTF